ncbi:ADP-ribosylglycohydrolase family protein [Microbispora sp. NBC_01189]|uniref:ADP-ribosylglycohydrolase family protein n=1 Tax=unclassified Microbispora TaxID=2614687 RepID=UPI002E112072|nr:ADP-ribosylglycohydrolase family protein [Microbispora sp. NBC_01189]
MSAKQATWANRVRGLVLGLALGESLGRGTAPTSGPVRTGVGAQLAAFTIEGVIRASVRVSHRGICHPPSVIWHAYCRWAALQGIEVHEHHRHWSEGSVGWPDGWLADVPLLRERRGSAPATVKALNQPEQGSTSHPATSSRGWHAVARSLPLAALSRTMSADGLADLARDVAALTHGDPLAYNATAAAAVLTGRCLSAGSLAEAAGHDPGPLRSPDVAAVLGRARAVFAQARRTPRRKDQLAQAAPDATAPSALLGATYVAGSCDEPDEAMEALSFAALAPDGSSVAAVTGAILGALYGVEVWPVELLSRLESAWLLDTLARDLVAEVTESPGGSEYAPPHDPFWLERYPGW